MLGIKDLIYRYRHNRGYGVQSPYAFHFVTSVIAEKHAYYAYPSINKAAKKCGYKAARARLLFRMTNYVRPRTIMMYAPCEAVVCAVSMARPSAQTYLFSGDATAEEKLKSVLRQEQTLGLLYVGDTPACASVVQHAIEYASIDSMIVIEGIHRSREMESFWHEIKQNTAVAVTFDLYSMGVLFFDKSYKKQHYTLKK